MKVTLHIVTPLETERHSLNVIMGNVLSPAGTSQPHNNMQPYLALTFECNQDDLAGLGPLIARDQRALSCGIFLIALIIALQGTFPLRG